MSLDQAVDLMSLGAPDSSRPRTVLAVLTGGTAAWQGLRTPFAPMSNP